MKTFYFAGLTMCAVTTAFAGGFGGVTPKTQPITNTVQSIPNTISTPVRTVSAPSRRMSLRYSDSQIPVIRPQINDLTRELDRQSAAQRKLLRLRNITY